MAEMRWYRSLYWRIATGFVALVATLLMLQGLVFLWMTGQMNEIFPTRSPAQFASAIATDIGALLVEQPGIDLHAHLRGTYSSPYRSFAVVLADGRVIESSRLAPPPVLARSAHRQLLVEGGNLRADGRGRRGEGSPAGGSRAEVETKAEVSGAAAAREGRGRWHFDSRRLFGRGGVPGGTEYARVLVDGDVVGMVAVPRELPPMSVTLREVGPMLGAVALVLLAAGTAVAALVIFRPTRRRLGALQDAARRIGAGELGARAPEIGGDEVSALSRAFNEMAGELERRTTALESADITRRRLLADVSHELTTPLAAIHGYVETLQMAHLQFDEPTRRRYLGIIGDEAERLEQIVGDLLDLARLEGGGTAFRSEDVSVASLLERVTHRHERIVAERGIELATHASADAQAFTGDQSRIEQALQNLVANAIRHTPAGGRVRVDISRQGDEIVMAVEDSGPGIPDEHLPRIFDRFYKADESRTGTEVPSGSGLGLSIVRAIVDRHGGTVSAANVPGGGARFEIRLPAGLR